MVGGLQTVQPPLQPLSSAFTEKAATDNKEVNDKAVSPQTWGCFGPKIVHPEAVGRGLHSSLERQEIL